MPNEEISRDLLSPVLSQIGAHRQKFGPVHPIGQRQKHFLTYYSLIADSGLGKQTSASKNCHQETVFYLTPCDVFFGF